MHKYQAPTKRTAPLFAGAAVLAAFALVVAAMVPMVRVTQHADASGVYQPPTTIDTSGDTDVSTALSQWIATDVPNGTAEEPTVVVLAGTFRVEYGLDIGNRNPRGDVAHPGLSASEKRHIIFDLSHASLVQRDPTPFSNVDGVITEPRKRWGVPIIKIVGGEDIRIVGGSLVSTNGNGRYAPIREPWHGVFVVGTQGLSIVGTHIEGVWGDFVYLNHSDTRRSSNVLIDGGSFWRNGRQGITLNAVEGLEVRNVEFRNVQRMLFDHEPDRRGGAVDVSIHDNFGNTGGLGYFNAVPLAATPIGNISITDNRIEDGHFKVLVGMGGLTRSEFTFVGNTTATTDLYQGGYLHRTALITAGNTTAAWNDVVIQHNHDHGTEMAMAIAVSPMATNVTTTPNDFVGFKPAAP